MSKVQAIQWFKQTFYKELSDSVSGTLFSVDQLCAIAYQETGYIWAGIRETHPHARIFELCTGDTLDSPNRSAFPKTRKELEAWPQGQQMFSIARQALVDVGTVRPEFEKIAKKYPNKFCHGFGIFQYDLQFFKTDAQWFLQRKWTSFDECRAHVIHELKAALKRQGWEKKSSLTDTERVHVCIAYNRGRSDLSKGFKQGHRDSSGRYYGEYIHEYLTIAKNIPPPSPAGITPPPPPVVTLPPPTPVEIVSTLHQVDVKSGSTLNVRATPEIPKTRPESNIRAKLPAGHIVQYRGGKKTADFWEIETSLNGAYVQGFASPKFLKPAPAATGIEIVQPAGEEPKTGVIAAHLTPRPGTVIARAAIAGAYSLNEKNMPARTGGTVEERCAQLAAIIAWLDPEKSAHKRYWPREGLTFCNIYAHDYCGRAGVYLPRVWWNGPALIRLAQGQAVEPAYGRTVDEQRANDLFRWLRDFGPQFGWRQTGTLTKLQEAANLGGVGIIVARRVQEGKSGHIVAVVPETQSRRAKRDANGEVTHPLQSQAGARNFRYGTGGTNWWLGSQFAESAFWIHA